MTDHSSESSSRRDFLKAAGAAGSLALLGACGTAEAAPVPGLAARRGVSLGGSSSDVVVVGAGIWGSFTAYHLRRMGAKVTLVDAYGPANSRATSGDESRGVRSSYGDRDTGEMWMLWAREAISRWKQFDTEWGKDLRLNLFHTTGDLILRPDWEPYLNRTRHWWDVHQVPYEILDADAVRRDFPVMAMDDITAVLYEPDAGVVRARRSVQTVAAAAEKLGARVVIGRARPGKVVNGKLTEVALDTGDTLRADTFLFAVGPWLGKTFPLFENRMRAPLGYVCYYGTPPGDNRFTFPNLPSFNFPGVTGWAALPVDCRGFRVRGGERAPAPPPKPGEKPPVRPAQRPPQPPTPPAQLDPDTSDRWADAARLEPTRRFVAHRFPALANAPLLQTHSCHYELSSSRNFIVDRHPDMANVWIAGGGNAEGFKFGPLMGEYVAQRVLGTEGDPAVAKGFRIPEKPFDPPAPAPPVAAAADSARGDTTRAKSSRATR